jgi:hypothetical protein
MRMKHLQDCMCSRHEREDNTPGCSFHAKLDRRWISVRPSDVVTAQEVRDVWNPGRDKRDTGVSRSGYFQLSAFSLKVSANSFH